MKLISTIFTVLTSVVLPVGAAIYMSTRKKGYLKPVLLGTLTFVVFQILTRLPLLQLVLPKMLWYTIFANTQPILYALFLGATAALFEEGGRFIVMTLFMKNRRRTSDGIAFGVGHGGIEAVLLVGINAIWLLILNDSSISPLNMFAGGFERFCTILIHIAFSVMVLKSVALKNPLWLLLAFVLHTVIDMAAVIMQQSGLSTIEIEAVIAVIALALLSYTLAESKKYKGADIL